MTASLLALARAGRLEARLQKLEQELSARTLLPSLTELEGLGISPISGRRFSLSIATDHPDAPILVLLQEAIQSRDGVILPIDAAAADVVITGTVETHGYQEVYVSAELKADWQGMRLLTFTRKPHSGDRPQNLAKEFVLELEKEFSRRLIRQERSQALDELTH